MTQTEVYEVEHFKWLIPQINIQPDLSKYQKLQGRKKKQRKKYNFLKWILFAKENILCQLLLWVHIIAISSFDIETAHTIQLKANFSVCVKSVCSFQTNRLCVSFFFGNMLFKILAFNLLWQITDFFRVVQPHFVGGLIPLVNYFAKLFCRICQIRLYYLHIWFDIDKSHCVRN